MIPELQIGDRVQTEIGTTGTIVEPESDMPLHHLILLDSGRKLYILRRLLDRCSEPKKRKAKSG